MIYIYIKLTEINKYKHSWRNGEVELNPNIGLDDRIRKIVLETQEVEPFLTFWGHNFDKEIENLVTLINRPKNQ